LTIDLIPSKIDIEKYIEAREDVGSLLL